ncbi:hypothetical protein MNBD_BACTEROID01-1925 [hydrothermal vent metagenome]|uniref:Uncharacterized protein n=1 Tax=hydrothermal vent metagenome TaxID=652676 RepID=A0A3B0TVT3_9ZZZZ
MIAGCILPIILIFLAPLFGIKNGLILLLLIVAVFAGHLMMISSHNNHNGHK